jgi:hypothetical protein
MQCTVDAMYADCDDTLTAYFGMLLVIVCTIGLAFYMMLWYMCRIDPVSLREMRSNEENLSKRDPGLLHQDGEEEDADRGEDITLPSYASVASVR